MRRTPIQIAGTRALAAILAVSVAACGSEKKRAACYRLQQTITQVSQSGISQDNGPNGLAQTYDHSATTIRREGRDSGDSDVKAAANGAASALEQLSRQLRMMAGNGDSAPQMPNSANLISAGDRIRWACAR
jgi:hypothetical protein